MDDLIDNRPLYQQVKSRIIKRIIDGHWPPGARLPSEAALGAEFGASQGTVRLALNELSTENRVIRRQGKGTFVPEHTAERALFYFFHLYGADGRRCRPESRVLSCRRLKANRKIAGKLGVKPGTPVKGIRRLRDIAGRNVIIEEIYVPEALFPDLGRPNPKSLPNTLYQLYEEKFGVTISSATEHLTAVAANAEDAGLLEVAEGTPLLEIERQAVSLDGTIAEFRRSRCLTSQIHYLNQLE